MTRRDDSKIITERFYDDVAGVSVLTMTLEDGTVLDSRREGESEKIRHEMKLSRQRWLRKKRRAVK